jgi:hypothetical protein
MNILSLTCCIPGDSLLGRWRRVVGKIDALGDVVLKTLVGSLEELLLGIVCLAHHIDGLLNAVGLLRVSVAVFRHQGRTYAELDGDGEELNADSLRNLFATRHAREVDVAGLDNTRLALCGLENSLREARKY